MGHAPMSDCLVRLAKSDQKVCEVESRIEILRVSIGIALKCIGSLCRLPQVHQARGVFKCRLVVLWVELQCP